MSLISEVGLVLVAAVGLMFYLTVFVSGKIPRCLEALRGNDSNARFKALRFLIPWGSIYRNLGRLFRLDRQDVVDITEAAHPMLDDDSPILRAMAAQVIGGFGCLYPDRWVKDLGLAREREMTRNTDERTRKFVMGEIDEARYQLGISRGIQQSRR